MGSLWFWGACQRPGKRQEDQVWLVSASRGPGEASGAGGVRGEGWGEGPRHPHEAEAGRTACQGSWGLDQPASHLLAVVGGARASSGCC